MLVGLVLVVGVLWWAAPYLAEVGAAAALALLTWPLYAVPAYILSLPIIKLGQRRAHWNKYDLTALVAPFLAWLALTLFGPIEKSMSNVVECLVIAAFVPAAALVRVAVGPRHDRACSLLATAALCVVALVTYMLVPRLPE
jgi:hypothetical protein